MSKGTLFQAARAAYLRQRMLPHIRRRQARAELRDRLQTQRWVNLHRSALEYLKVTDPLPDLLARKTNFGLPVR